MILNINNTPFLVLRKYTLDDNAYYAIYKNCRYVVLIRDDKRFLNFNCKVFSLDSFETFARFDIDEKTKKQLKEKFG